MLIYWFMIAISYWFTHCPLLDLFRLHQELLNILFWHTFFVLSKILPSSSGWYNIPPVYDLLNEASGFTSWPNFAIYPNPLKKKKKTQSHYFGLVVYNILLSVLMIINDISIQRHSNLISFFLYKSFIFFTSPIEYYKFCLLILSNVLKLKVNAVIFPKIMLTIFPA